jgi:CheY-like chemotaxis protein
LRIAFETLNGHFRRFQALTANSSDELRERYRQQGMQAFLSKPLEPGELWTIVSRYLN